MSFDITGLQRPLTQPEHYLLNALLFRLDGFG
jgi:hypothetical protein